VLFTLSCSLVTSLSAKTIFMSSTKNTTFVSGIYCRKSFMYSKNRRGPKMDPCGIRCLIALHVDLWFWLHIYSVFATISTYCERYDR
jgi:hypothetical protein